MLCEVCNKGLKNITTLLKHMNSVHKTHTRNVENPNKILTRCDKCPTFCNGETGLRVHVNSMHKDQLSQSNSDLPTEDSDEDNDSEEDVPTGNNNSITSSDPFDNIFKILSSDIQVPRLVSRDMENHIISLIGSIVEDLEFCAEGADSAGQILQHMLSNAFH